MYSFINGVWRLANNVCWMLQKAVFQCHKLSIKWKTNLILGICVEFFFCLHQILVLLSECRSRYPMCFRVQHVVNSETLFCIPCLYSGYLVYCYPPISSKQSGCSSLYSLLFSPGHTSTSLGYLPHALYSHYSSASSANIIVHAKSYQTPSVNLSITTANKRGVRGEP